MPVEHIHPMLVHFPIVLVLGLAAVDIYGLFRDERSDRRQGGLSTAIAVLAGVAAVAAYFFGDAAYDIAIDKGFPEAALETHEGLGTSVAIILGLWALLRGWLWWRQVPLTSGRRTAIVGVEMIAAVLVLVTAYFGGQLVYELGVNVAAVKPALAAPNQ